MSRKRLLLVIAALVVINLPWVLSTWRAHQIAADGEHVTAAVVRTSATGGGEGLVYFRFDKTVDAKQTVRQAKVDATAYDEATARGQVGVRVLKGDPAAYLVDGQVRSHAGTIVTVIGDLLVLALVMLGLRLGRGLRRPPLEAVALGDVEPGGEESLLDKQPDGSYVICGRVKERGGDRMVLALRDRDVTVHLRGHAGELDGDQPARVRAHLVG